jgi:hypothetical protein
VSGYGIAFATAMRAGSMGIGRWISISIEVPTSSLTSGPRFNRAQATPATARVIIP